MENGYNFVRLDPLHGKGEVWLRRWDKYGGGWVPLVVADNKTDHDGCWPLPSLTWLRPTPEPGGQGGQPVSAVDLRKVHAEIGKLLAKSAGEELRKALLTEAGQGQGSKAEDVLLPPGTPFELEAAINRLHEAAKVARAGLVERRPAQTDEFVQLSASILGWLLLLAVREDWAAAGGGLGDVELIEIPVTTEAGLEIVTARLRGHEARMNVGADLGVHGRDRLAYGDLELGLTQTDALREVKRLIWVKVMKTEPPPGGDWEARLASTLRLRHRRNEGNYYISIPGDRPGDTPHHQDMLRRLRTDLPELRFFVIGGSAGGVLLLPENDLEALISEFFVQALGKFQ
jgi:hypothetical protein